MKSAEALVRALKQGIDIKAALSSLTPYELRYIARVPINIYHAAQYLGWHFVPVPRLGTTGKHLCLREATSDLERLKQWARSRPHFALATGALSGVLVLSVDGSCDGQNSLIRLCGDDWDWLDTLRTQAGPKRFLFFAWPAGRRQLEGCNYLGKGLRVLGEGDWVLVPPAREGNILHVFLNPQLALARAPEWLLDLVFESETELGQSLPLAS